MISSVWSKARQPPLLPRSNTAAVFPGSLRSLSLPVTTGHAVIRRLVSVRTTPVSTLATPATAVEASSSESAKWVTHSAVPQQIVSRSTPARFRSTRGRLSWFQQFDSPCATNTKEVLRTPTCAYETTTTTMTGANAISGSYTPPSTSILSNALPLCSGTRSGRIMGFALPRPRSVHALFPALSYHQEPWSCWHQPTRGFVSSSASSYAQPYFAMKNSQGVTLRVHLTKSRDFVGIRSTRCQRKYNQDRYKVLVLNPPTGVQPPNSSSAATSSTSSSTTTSTSSSSSSVNPQDPQHAPQKSTEDTQMDSDQKTLFYFAIFDGHGGSHTADFLTAHLDEYIEQATPGMVPNVVKDLRKLGGYFRGFRPHFLEPFLPADFEGKHGGGGRSSSAEAARRERKVHIKGKGGQIKPMIFIPHPNATEEEQNEEMASLEHDTRPSSTAASDQVEDEYDEDEDPFVIRHRRERNKTSPLPGGTTSYFGTDRSEYEHLVVREQNMAQAATTETQQPPVPIPTTMTLEQRLCLSFLQCDTKLIRDKYEDGSTASVVVVQSKGAFWETKADLDLILAHVGDTRILLCEAPRGESIQLTTDHHPDAVVESDRIRKLATYVSADSFGENMFLGHVANTRSLGDIAMKPYGVSAEPELIRRTVKANEAAFLVLMSDGISSVMSNQEVVDCVKLESDPTQAAANVLNLAEQLGAEDNCTIMVVKLPAWGTKMPDLSKELREYRWQSEAQQSRARRR